MLFILVFLLIIVVGFGQAVGLMALSWILFGGLRGGRSSRQGWRHTMRERWGGMTLEERERFRKGLRGRCAPAVPGPESPTPAS